MRLNPSCQRGFHVLAYHMVEPRFDFGITRVTPRQFRKQMDWLARTGFQLVRLEAVFRDDGAPAKVAVTFDDAYSSVYSGAFPILAERSWVATVFPVVGYVGSLNTWDVNIGGLKFPHMDWGHLRELVAAGWQIGSHGWSHRNLNVLSDHELRRELAKSKEMLEDRLQVPVTCFSPPFGRISERVLDALQEHGYREICLLDGWRKEPVQTRNSLRIIRRRGVYLVDMMWDFRHKFSEDGIGVAWQDAKQAVINWANRGTAVVQLLREKTLAILARFS